MGSYGYIGAVPTQLQEKNTGLFSNEDINKLRRETPSRYRGEFISLDVVAVAGGGGGGGGSTLSGTGVTRGGGGGAGEYYISENNNTFFKVGTNYAITIGAGGAGSASAGSNNGSGQQGSAGSDTTFAYAGGTITLKGGGGGGGTSGHASGLAGGTGGSGGGSGGGGSSSASGAASTSSDGQGNAGGQGQTGGWAAGGAGGGAFAAGSNNDATNPLPFGGHSLHDMKGAGDSPGQRNGYFIDWVLAEATRRGSMMAAGGGHSSTQNHSIANTGNGGMGGYNMVGGTGGSGVVAFRYPKELTMTVGGSLTSATNTVGNYKITEIKSGTDNVSWAY